MMRIIVTINREQTASFSVRMTLRIIVTINREQIAIIFSWNDIKDYSDHKLTIMKSFN